MPIYTGTGGSASVTTTVGELVNRVYRDFLDGPDDQPPIVTASAGYTDSVTTIGYDDSVLAPDEEDLLAPGVLVEVGSELARITGVDDTANTLTVIRGVSGTTAEAISAGDEIRIAPMYPRQTVFDAVADNIVGLYPDLTRTATTTVTSGSAAAEIPAGVVSVIDAMYLSGNSQVGANVRLLRNYVPSSTGSAVAFSGTPANKTVYLTYEARFDRPATTDDTLVDLGIDAAWERIVVVGAAAQVLAGRDLDPVSAEYLTEQMEREGFPVGSAGRLRDNLLRYHAFLLQQARRSIRADRVTPVVMSY